MQGTKSLTCKSPHQRPIKLLARLPIFYKSSTTFAPKHPEVAYGLSRQLKKTVPSVSSQRQKEGSPKDTPEPCITPRRDLYNQNRVQIKYSKIHSSLKDSVQSTLSVLNTVPDHHPLFLNCLQIRKPESRTP